MVVHGGCLGWLWHRATSCRLTVSCRPRAVRTYHGAHGEYSDYIYWDPPKCRPMDILRLCPNFTYMTLCMNFPDFGGLIKSLLL